MRLFSLGIVCATLISESLGQTLPVPATAGASTNAASTSTNLAEAAVLQKLEEKIANLEAKTQQENSRQVDQLNEKLFQAEQKLEDVRKTEDVNRSTLYTVVFVIVALAAISIIGLVAFCFYTLRRLTQLGEPIFDNL